MHVSTRFARQKAEELAESADEAGLVPIADQVGDLADRDALALRFSASMRRATSSWRISFSETTA